MPKSCETDCVPGLLVPRSCPPSQEPSCLPLGSRASEVPGVVSFGIGPFLHPSRPPPGGQADCMVSESGSLPPSPAQGRSKNAKRTSSGAGMSAASPLCGDATRMMTAPTTATRTTAVSGGQDWERTVGGAMLSAHVAAAAAGPPAWTLQGQLEAGKPTGRRLPRSRVALSNTAGAGRQTCPNGVWGGAGGDVALKERTPHPVAGPEL